MIVSLEQAAELLNSGHVVAIPTETVYGLAAAISHPKAIENIFQLKKRPAANPLIIHLAETELLENYATEISASARKLAANFWPGPLTLVLPANISIIPATVRAGLPTAAFRVPDHIQTRHLLKITGPLVMPSANLSGKPSATTAEHVATDFGQKMPVLEGIEARCGLESTILKQYGELWKIIRVGALPAEAFTEVLGYTPSFEATKSGAPLCPGQLFRHYAPEAQLIPTTQFSEANESVVVGFSDRAYPVNYFLYTLGPSQRPEIVAENLYAVLRMLDRDGIKKAYLDMNFPQEGLWVTIAERLHKASQK